MISTRRIKYMSMRCTSKAISSPRLDAYPARTAVAAMTKSARRLRDRLDLPLNWVRRALVPRVLRARRVRRGSESPTGRRMIYIDLSVISVDDFGTGIQRVVRALAQALVLQCQPRYDIQFVAATREHGYRRIGWPDPGEAPTGETIRARPGDIFVGLDYALDAVRWHRRQLAQFRRDGGLIWFLVHDLLPANRPDWFSRRGVLRHRIWLDTVAAIGDGFLCNSPQTEADLIAELRRYRLSRDVYRTCVLPMGHNISEAAREPSVPADTPGRIRALEGKPFFLKVGTLEPRKGHDLLISAFEQLWASGFDHRLVLIGRLGWRVDALYKTILTHPELGQRLLWLADVNDSELIGAYRASEGVLVASLAEGFGLPLIEALGHGKPVLARDLPIFHLHAANGVRYFPADATPQVMADYIMQWRDAIRAGDVLVRAPQTGWREAAHVLLAAVTA
jgi:glycosyltransferase involved in cell wall biosynthesis